MGKCLVSISEQAFFSIITSALEAYKVEHGMNAGGSSAYVETFGHLWGYKKIDELSGDGLYRVVWADTSTAVDRHRDSIAPKDAAQELKQDFVDVFFPEVSYLGDFHSHPYSLLLDGVSTELEVEKKGLYKFSDSDFKSVKYLQDEAFLSYQVGLVVTVFEREQQVKRSFKLLDGASCLRFQYKNLTIWIKSYVWDGDLDSGYRRKADRMVRLKCQGLIFE